MEKNVNKSCFEIIFKYIEVIFALICIKIYIYIKPYIYIYIFEYISMQILLLNFDFKILILKYKMIKKISNLLKQILSNEDIFF